MVAGSKQTVHPFSDELARRMPTKADLRRSACIGALIQSILFAAPLWSDDRVSAVTPQDCASDPLAQGSECVPAVPQTPDAPEADPAQGQQLTRQERDRVFAPTRIDDQRPELDPLHAEAPGHKPQGLEVLPSMAQGPDAAQDLPERDPQKAGARPSATSPQNKREDAVAESRLYEGLTWDYCGPRPGVTHLAPAAPFDDKTPIDITANRVDYDQAQDVIHLEGDIEILQNDRRLEADRSDYDRRTGEVDAAGHVYLESPGLRLTGDESQYNLETRKGDIENARYRMSGDANLRGRADRAWMLSEQVTRYDDILYTTCPPGQSDWSLLASDLELDQAEGMGTAHHARIRIADIPVLYTPYLRFPIDSRRRSGFLIPMLGSSDETGTDISIPYYWNIAPNMDATITPRYMSLRGLMLGTQIRHLASFQELEVDAEILPRDEKAPDEGLRGALKVIQQGRLGNRWTTRIDYASVSDDDYLGDFGNRLDTTSVRNLSQLADLYYSGDGWGLLTRIQDFQTVDASIAPQNRPYSQKPHIELTVAPKTWNGLEYGFDGQYDYFDHSAAVHGSRLVAIPSLRLPLRRGYGYLIPRARLYYKGYDLVDQGDGMDDKPSYAIPGLDIDGKLIFERETDWFGHGAMQTLEPRLYYVLTPYEDQSDLPRFDTTALDFSFSSLFRPNRFTGYDRIGDENRLTLGLTSRTIANRSGQELFRASLGQIYYFDSRRVQLTGDDAESDVTSSMAGEFSAQLHQDWSAVASLQWNPNETEQPWEKQVFQVRYAPDEERLLNLAYRYNLGNDQSEEYEDADLSFQMPLGSKVRVVGRWLYSMLNDETVEAFAGVEFGRCCWRLRILGQHLKRSADSNGSTSVMLQLELAGLGSFGNQIDKLLERGIYGYHTN
ncbi:LPS-assembly protein LptD [Imhoffiella purpurea]|uniref:LPS-assembly protein LptD n=1 Tax=Imhoffiella purpurea TaxID=1249627 RepID=W9VVA3_9GAMM|nr:LPS-assembly protein LptD [Imhoffiella purpurea]EXJ14310.1 Outer membrane protein Imp [Imhoffiella purpurea]